MNENMKHFWVLFFALYSSLCFSQDELGFNLSYDRNSQILLVKLKNQTEYFLGLDKGMEAPKVYDGSVFYITDILKDKYHEDEMFTLMEYDETNSKFKKNIFRRIIWMQPHEEKCFAVSIKGKNKLLKSGRVFVRIHIDIAIPPKIKGSKTYFKEIITDVYEVPLNE